jgi:hypothetical protein
MTQELPEPPDKIDDWFTSPRFAVRVIEFEPNAPTEHLTLSATDLELLFMAVRRWIETRQHTTSLPSGEVARDAIDVSELDDGSTAEGQELLTRMVQWFGRDLGTTGW